MTTYSTTIEGANNGAVFNTYYAYDANGNITQRIEGRVVYMQVWDVDNRLLQVYCATNPIRLYYRPDGSTFYVNADLTKALAG